MSVIVEQINSAGYVFIEFAFPILIQSSVLILILLLVDLLLRRKIRAVFRYWIWMLVLLKFVLPTSLSTPVSLGHWFGKDLASVGIGQMFGIRDTAKPTPGNISPTIAPVRIETDRELSPTESITEGEVIVTEPASSIAASDTSMTWQGFIFLSWLAVVAVMVIMLLQRALFVMGLVAQAKRANSSMNDTLMRCCESMGVRRKVGLRISPNVTSPAVCCLFRPVILLPENLILNLDTNQLRVILMHELAHVKRRDLWIHCGQTLLQIIYFYNPLLWLANTIIRRVREQAVDEMVLVMMGEAAQQYPQTLVNVAKLAFRGPALSLRFIGIMESKSLLEWRIRTMLNRPIPKSSKLGILSIIVIFTTATVLLPMARAQRSEQTQSPSVGEVVSDPDTGLHYRQVRRLPGEDLVEFTTFTTPWLALSPNNKFFLYQNQILPLEGGELFELVDSLVPPSEWSFYGSWSPDGTKIAFQSGGIWVVPVSPDTSRPTGPARKVIENGGRLNWSPDSQEFVYRSGQHLWIYSLQDGSKRQLTEEPGRQSSWSHSGKWIADERDDGYIWLVPAKGGTARQLARKGGRIVPHWLPGDEWIFYQLSGELHFVRVSDAARISIDKPKEVGSYLSCSKDGKKLLFFRHTYDWKMSLKILPASGGTPWKPLKNLKHSGVYGQYWSPDSRFVVTSDYVNQWIVPISGAEPFPLELNVDVGDKSWPMSLSPDCKRLLFGVGKDGRQERWVVPFSIEQAKTTGEPVMVFDGSLRSRRGNPGGSKPSNIIWNPGSNRFAAIYEDDIWIINTDGSSPFQLTDTPDQEFGLVWFNDGRTIAWRSRSESSQGVNLYACELPDREPKRLIDVPGAYGHQLTSDGSRIAYLADDGDKSILSVTTVAEGHTLRLMELKKDLRSQFACAFSPNGREIAVMSEGKLSIYSLPSGKRRDIYNVGDSVSLRYPRRIVWSPDGTTLLLWLHNSYRFFAVPAKGGKCTELAADDNGVKYSLDWSPDSNWITYSSDAEVKSRPASTIWEVEVDSFLRKAAEEVAVSSNPAEDSE